MPDVPEVCSKMNDVVQKDDSYVEKGAGGRIPTYHRLRSKEKQGSCKKEVFSS
jgi:hypothetical protein